MLGVTAACFLSRTPDLYWPSRLFRLGESKRGMWSVSPLSTALTPNTLVTPLESALTKNAGGWGSRLLWIQESHAPSVLASPLFSVDCRLFESLVPLFRLSSVSFQWLAASFLNTGGVLPPIFSAPSSLYGKIHPGLPAAGRRNHARPSRRLPEISRRPQ